MERLSLLSGAATGMVQSHNLLVELEEELS